MPLKFSIDIGDGVSLSATWKDMTALQIYNRLLAGMPIHMERTTTQRRLIALDVFRRRFTLRLGDLCEELHENWRHWKHTPPNYLDVNKCCKSITALFKRIEKAGRPVNLDSWRPTVKRGRNVSGDADKIVRRFLDPSFCKPKTNQRGRTAKPKIYINCRIHSDRPSAHSNGMCQMCYQRYNKFRSMDILKANTAPVLVDAVLKLPAIRGRNSTLIEDARRLVAEYEN